MFVFKKSFFNNLKDNMKARTDDELSTKVFNTYRDYFMKKGAERDDIINLCKHAREMAECYGMEKKKNVLALAYIAVSFGAHFDVDVRFQSFTQNVLSNGEVSEDERIEQLSKIFKLRFDSIWKDVGYAAIADKVLSVLSLPLSSYNNRKPREIVDQVFPHQWQDIPPNLKSAFVESCTDQYNHLSLKHDFIHTLMTVCALAYGQFWIIDPQHRALQECIFKSDSAEEAQDRALSYFGGLSNG